MRTKFTRCRYNKQADESEGSKLGNYNKIFPEPLCDFVQQRLVRSLAFVVCVVVVVGTVQFSIQMFIVSKIILST